MIRMLLATAVVALTPTSTFPSGAISSSATHEIPRLDAAASALAGRHVQVNCWARQDWNAMLANAVRAGETNLPEAAAFTNPGLHQVQIGPDTCEVLGKLLAHRPLREIDEADAILVLAHESMHARGIESESKAECEGMGAIPKAARILGVPTREAARLERIYRGTSYPSNEPAYRSRSCPYGLPGIALPNVFGPDASVAHLRSGLRRVGAALMGWRKAPAPPVSSLGPCASTTLQAEVARVEQMFASGGVIADVVGAQFHSRAGLQQVVARGVRSSRCSTTHEVQRLHKFDAAAKGTVERFDVPGAAEADRAVVRSKTLQGGALYVDSIVVSEPAFKGGYVLLFESYRTPPPRKAEVAAVQALTALTQ